MFKTCWGFNMAYRRLYIWVEGIADRQFFFEIIKPFFEPAYDEIQFVLYAGQSKVNMKSYFDSINSLGADYIFVADLDENPCITQKLEKVRQTYPYFKQERVQIVVKEIEGWYIAGLSNENSKQLKIKPVRNTSSLTKEQFNRMVPVKHLKTKISRLNFRDELLRLFSMETAVSKNTSFRYFVEKYNLEAIT